MVLLVLPLLWLRNGYKTYPLRFAFWFLYMGNVELEQTSFFMVLLEQEERS